MKSYSLCEAIDRDDIVHVIDTARNKLVTNRYQTGKTIKLPPDPYHGDETIKITKKLIRGGFHHSTSISPSQDMVTDVVGYVGKGRGKGVGKKHEVYTKKPSRNH